MNKRHYEVYTSQRLPDEVKAAVEKINGQVPYVIDFTYLFSHSDEGPDAKGELQGLLSQ